MALEFHDLFNITRIKCFILCEPIVLTHFNILRACPDQILQDKTKGVCMLVMHLSYSVQKVVMHAEFPKI